MTRIDWQKLADEREADALALLGAGRWACAYYIAGYAVESGLKACVLVQLVSAPEVVYLEKRYSEKCWTHNLEELVDLAGLAAVRAADIAANVDLKKNWTTVKDWSEQTRYILKDEAAARKLVAAAFDKPNGVLPWIKARW